MSPTIVLHVKRWISKSYSHCWKGFKFAENVGKPKNVQELEDLSEEQWMLRTNKGLMNNYHKTERQPWIIQEMTRCIRFKGMYTFERGHFYKFIYYFVLWRIYKHILCYSIK